MDTGLSDEVFLNVLETLPEIFKDFEPDVVVMQLGADGLHGDPKGCWNLSEKGYLYAVSIAIKMCKKLLLLGGGGYNHANTARLWAQVTNFVLGNNECKLDLDFEYAMEFAPTYDLLIETGFQIDYNLN